MGSAVIDLQRDALNKDVAISDLLRKAYVVSRKLGIEEFERWVSCELNGYNNSDDTPSYRQITGQVKGWNPYHGWQPVYFPDHEIQ